MAKRQALPFEHEEGYTHPMKGLSLAVAVAGVLALDASRAAAFPTDTAVSKAGPTFIADAQWHGTQWVDPHCLKPSWSHRCRLHLRRSGAWPGSIPGCVYIYPYRGPCACCTAPDREQWEGYD